MAIEGRLLEKFDDLISRRGYTNRSEAFRDLIRADLVNDVAEQPSSTIVGTITLLYDHHVRLLNEKLTSLQHEHHHAILSSLHVHLDHDHCLEVIVLKGKAAEIRKIADLLIAAKGVKHGKLTVTTLGQAL